MGPFVVQTAAEQVASYIRRKIVERHWVDTMPGGGKLARELGVGRMTMEAALQALESEGVLKLQGPGHPRRVSPTFLSALQPSTLSVALLTYEPQDLTCPPTIEVCQSLEKLGHSVTIATKSFSKIDYKLERAKRLVLDTPADCWIVYAGSQELLQWFAQQPTPAFALFGRRTKCALPGTGPDVISPTREIVRRLVELGHRRVVMIAREERVKPIPGSLEVAFLEELKASGLPTGDYNLPDWISTPKGIADLLQRLFATTPPTALLFQEPELYFAALPILGALGKRVPQDVSLFCTTSSPLFRWQIPTVAHISWDSHGAARRIIQWVQNVSKGREDIRQTMTKAEIVDGDSIGPARAR